MLILQPQKKVDGKLGPGLISPGTDWSQVSWVQLSFPRPLRARPGCVTRDVSLALLASGLQDNAKRDVLSHEQRQNQRRSTVGCEGKQLGGTRG